MPILAVGASKRTVTEDFGAAMDAHGDEIKAPRHGPPSFPVTAPWLNWETMKRIEYPLGFR
jgi:hypothetical protein